MKQIVNNKIEVETILKPETDIEKALLQHPDFYTGLLWGKPRFGHPEGKVVFHIREVLDNVDKLDVSDLQREQLRIITFVHDTFKYREDRSTPRDWTKHHSVLAKNFAENYVNDQSLLDIIEHHDEAYYAWQLHHVYKNPEAGKKRLNELLDLLGDGLQLYYLFFKCDTCTGDKTLASVHWFENVVKGIDLVDL